MRNEKSRSCAAKMAGCAQQNGRLRAFNVAGKQGNGN
jgi:hypothetical protein